MPKFKKLEDAVAYCEKMGCKKGWIVERGRTFVVEKPDTKKTTRKKTGRKKTTQKTTRKKTAKTPREAFIARQLRSKKASSRKQAIAQWNFRQRAKKR